MADADDAVYKGFSKSLTELSNIFNQYLDCDTIYYDNFDGNYYTEISNDEEYKEIKEIDVKEYLTKYSEIYQRL